MSAALDQPLPRLMRLKRWAESRFTDPEDRPCDKTLYKMCEDGRIPAKRFGGRGEWYVEIDLELKQTGNEIVDRILLGG